jgi:RimJ/RimL family protein N-acetyltransferase
MATSHRRLSPPEPGTQASYDLRLAPLPVGVARLMLAGRLRAARPGNLHPDRSTLRPEPGNLRPEPENLRAEPENLRPEPVEGQQPSWHREYPLPDSIDAIAMVFAAHRAMLGAVTESPGWWIHQIVVDGVVVGDIGFHGPPSPELAVEIGYTVVPAWRGRRVASRACALILQQAWRDGANSVVAETDADNVASQAVLLRNGFQRRPDGIFMINHPEAR